MSPPETSHHQSDHPSGCTQADDRLTAYLDGELPAPQERQVAEHLLGCPVCQAQVAELRFAMEAIQRALASAPSPAPPELLVGVRRAVNEETPATGTPESGPGEVRALLVRVGGMALAACFLVVVALTMHLGQPPTVHVAHDPEATPEPEDSLVPEQADRKVVGEGSEDPEAPASDWNGKSRPRASDERGASLKLGVVQLTREEKDKAVEDGLPEAESAEAGREGGAPGADTPVPRALEIPAEPPVEGDEEHLDLEARHLVKGARTPDAGGRGRPVEESELVRGTARVEELEDQGPEDPGPEGPEGELTRRLSTPPHRDEDDGGFLDEETEEEAKEELRRSRYRERLRQKPSERGGAPEGAPAPGSGSAPGFKDQPGSGEPPRPSGEELDCPPAPDGAEMEGSGEPLGAAPARPAAPPDEQPLSPELLEERLGQEQPLQQPLQRVRIQVSTPAERRWLMAAVRPYLAAEERQSGSRSERFLQEPQEDEPHTWGLLPPPRRVRLALTPGQLEALRLRVEKQKGGLTWLPPEPRDGSFRKDATPTPGAGVRDQRSRALSPEKEGADRGEPLLQVELVLLEVEPR